VNFRLLIAHCINFFRLIDLNIIFGPDAKKEAGTVDSCFFGVLITLT
jgi:hypothetical protein